MRNLYTKKEDVVLACVISVLYTNNIANVRSPVSIV